MIGDSSFLNIKSVKSFELYKLAVLPPEVRQARGRARADNKTSMVDGVLLARKVDLQALGLLGLALAVAASWRSLPCPHYWGARELQVLRVGANASSAATETVRPTLVSLLAARSLGSLLTSSGTDAYTSDGRRLQCASEATPNSTVYLADTGRPWQWAPERPGHERRVLLPGELTLYDEPHELTLTTLGVEPALFRVRGLLTPQEAAAL